MFICSLDAEKCFDSIWHERFFYKLQSFFPDILCYIYILYRNIIAVIKWNGHVHNNLTFNVFRSIR